MNYYLEITLLPDAEIPLYFLWERVYQQLHLAFVASKEKKDISPIGISFPNYDSAKHQLGQKLRLFAETDVLLERFNAREWLINLSDYVHLTSIKPIPEKIEKYACFYRIHTKSDFNRAKRRAKLANISFEQALEFFTGRNETGLINAPYIRLKSQTSGERFRLFIGYAEQTEKHYTGFSCYGLSRQSRVPIF
jgi:CRISPR-associated endonuclease Csy4